MLFKMKRMKISLEKKTLRKVEKLMICAQNMKIPHLKWNNRILKSQKRCKIDMKDKKNKI